MKQDQKLVAHSEDYEIDYIVDRYEIPKDVVEATMLSLGKDGKYCRSRKKIYQALRELGYIIETKKPEPKPAHYNM